MKNNESGNISPPYIPWETLKTFLRTLKESAVPNRIDSSMMPTTMSGFNKAGVTTALKFFSLIDSDGDAKSTLKEVVDAIETKEWPSVVKNILIPAYDDIVGDLKVDTTTRKQLEERFGEASQAMKERFIRFYIPLLQDAGETVSPYLMQRQSGPRKSGPRKTIRRRRETSQDDDRSGSTRQTPASKTPDDMFEQIFPIGMDNKSFIRVPRNIDNNQFELVKAAINVIEIMAKQNTESKK